MPIVDPLPYEPEQIVQLPTSGNPTPDANYNFRITQALLPTSAEKEWLGDGPFAPIADPVFTGDPQAPTPDVDDNDTSVATTAFVQAIRALLAPLADPIFTGNPQAPTPAPGDNDTSLATTAFVTAALIAALAAYAPLADPVFTGNPQAPTPAPGDNDTSVATTAFVAAALLAALAAYAPLANPVFTGNPQAPTPAPGDNDTSIATTAFIAAAIAVLAPLANPVFTGNPQAPTPAPGDNDTSIATTAFVTAALVAALAAYAPLANPVFTGNPQVPTQATADNDTSAASTAFVHNVADALGLALDGGAPVNLNTFVELAAAINNDPAFFTTVNTALGGKQPLHANLTTLAGLASVANLSTVAGYASVANLTTLVGYASLANLGTLLGYGSMANLTTLVGYATMANLTGFAGAGSAADTFAYFTSGAGAMARSAVTVQARNLLDDPDNTTMQATLGLGAIATYDTPLKKTRDGDYLFRNQATLSATNAGATVQSANTIGGKSPVYNFGLAVTANSGGWQTNCDATAVNTSSGTPRLQDWGTISTVCSVYIPTLSVGGDAFLAYVGIATSIANAGTLPTTGAFFRFNGANLECVNDNAGTETLYTWPTAVLANTWYRCRLVYTSAGVSFYVRVGAGAEQFIVTNTTNMPPNTSLVRDFRQAVNTALTATKTISFFLPTVECYN